jgi:acetyl-CoA carboxylase biotin carboxyl carrier protein
MSQTKPKDKDIDGGNARKPATDVQQLKGLIDLMVEHDLSRLELREGETHILLRRGQPIISAHGNTAPAALPLPAPTSAASPASAAPPAGGEEAASNEILIRSPMVGTFYSASDPESPPFVNVGSDVTPDTVVCIVEAMKVFNEIKAEVSGRITRLLVKNAEAVEFDQPLFAVTPA